MELILKDKLVKDIKAECDPYGAPTLDYDTSLKILKIIDRQNTKEEIKATWVEEEHKQVRLEDGKILSVVSAKCSNCNHYSEELNKFPPYMHYKFCPHCGAEME